MQDDQAYSHQGLPGQASSLWIADTADTQYPSLAGELRVDVAVIGGGIVGLTTALLLKKAGADVAVIEAGRIAQGVSGHTTAKVTVAHDLIYDDLTRRLGREKAQQYALANQAGLDFIADFIAENKVQCDFQRTFAATYTAQDRFRSSIEAEAAAAKALGLPARFVDILPLPYAIKGAVCFDQQAFFHPRKYLLALAKAAHDAGCAIYEKSRVLNIKERKPCVVRTRAARVKARQVVVATHFPVTNRGLLFARLAPFRSYVIAVKTREAPPEGMYISVEEPLRSVRRHVSETGEALLLVGGENHEVGHRRHTAECYLQLDKFARDHFNVAETRHRWSTQDNHTLDRVPFIGRIASTSSHLFVATGMKGWGMTGGTAAGLILADLISGRDNPWAAVFDPARVTSYLTTAFLERNMHVGKSFIKDMFLRNQDRAADLAPGAAGLTQNSQGESVAAYKDQAGLHMVSPYCVHMGCKVAWNDAEASWDCPCHGSRYGFDGSVLHAPASSGLKPKGWKG